MPHKDITKYKTKHIKLSSYTSLKYDCTKNMLPLVTELKAEELRCQDAETSVITLCEWVEAVTSHLDTCQLPSLSKVTLADQCRDHTLLVNDIYARKDEIDTFHDDVEQYPDGEQVIDTPLYH